MGMQATIHFFCLVSSGWNKTNPLVQQVAVATGPGERAMEPVLVMRRSQRPRDGHWTAASDHQNPKLCSFDD